MNSRSSSEVGGSQHPDLATALLYEHDEFLESLRGAVVAAGATVAAEIRLSELTAGQLDQLDAGVLLVNLEAVLDRQPDILDLVLHEQGDRRLILNDAAASSRLEGSDRARWIRHLAAKMGGHREWLPPRPPDTRESAADFDVWVLGASIGGPEAVRSFLSTLMPACPAALILAQHIGPEFVDTMVQQLQGVSTLPVRRAQAGDPVRPGEVLVVPVDQQWGVDAAGTVTLSPFEAPPAYSPCIDDVLRSATDRFGRRCHAIIFSGMASDGVAGARYLVERGGDLWVQEAESCVVASMVEGALKTGQVSLQGQPDVLAQKFNERYHYEESVHGTTGG